MSVTVILLPLRPASLTHKNPQRCKIICCMHASRRTQRSIDRSEDVFVEYVCEISVAVLVAVV